MISYNYTIGVVGCGYWGFNIIKTLQQIGIKNIFIYDKNIKNSLLINKTFKSAKIAKSFNELLINKNIKSLIFATPPSENFYLCQKALKNNKNIFVEKPVVKKKELLLKLHKLSVLKKLIFMSGYIYIYNDYINYIKKILKKKEIGKILYVQFLRKNFGPIRDKVNSYEDLGTHDLSILLFLFGDIFTIKTITKHNILKKNISDISYLQLQTKDFKIDIESSWLNPEKIRKILLIGKKKMLLFDEMNIGTPIKIYNKYVYYPKLFSKNKNKYFNKAKIFTGLTSEPKIKYTNPLSNELKHFLHCVIKTKTPKTDSLFAFKVLKKLDRIN
jgi:predicted dehydrogenase